MKSLKSLKVGLHSRRLMTTAEATLEALPTDLILKIFSKLPSKTIAIWRCVSKLWATLLESPDFTELFLTQSTTRPRILFTVRRSNREWCLYSCPQPQISDKKNPVSCLSITAEFHMSLLNHWVYEMSPSISGLIYSPTTQDLCNPSTRQLLRLPNPPSSVKHSFFGYDTIDKQFSILAICNEDGSSSFQILKLGSGRKLSWRRLKCPLDHYYPSKISVCINGVLYYITTSPQKIVCFDLNSEEFKFIDTPWPRTVNLLVNFKGKLGGIETKWENHGVYEYVLKLSLWVLEDVEKQEWSEHVYRLPPMSKLWWNKDSEPYRILGLTGNGDIVLALTNTTDLFYVYFFNLEKNILQRVEIKGFEELFMGYDGQGYYFHACVDYAEELRGLKWS